MSGISRANRQGGSALVISLLVLFVLMASGAATVSLTLSRQSAAKTVVEVDHAFVVAEAGVNLALFELGIGTDLAGDGLGVVVGSLGRGDYSATIAPAYTAPGQYTIQAIGTVGGVSRGVEAVVDNLSGTSPGFLGLDDVKVSGGLVDSYESSLGSYASQVVGAYAGNDAVLGTNGDVDLSGGYDVYGDVTPGPTGLATGDTSFVTGSTAPASELRTVDAYTYAPSIGSSGSYTGTATLTSGAYRYDDVSVSGTNVLTLTGNVDLYVDDTFDVSGSGKVVVSPGATVTIHHGENDFKISGSGIANSDQVPGQLRIFSASTVKFESSGSSAFYGSVHAPYADAVISGAGGVYGGLVAKTIELSGGAHLHHDLSLSSGGAGPFAVLMMRPFQP